MSNVLVYRTVISTEFLSLSLKVLIVDGFKFLILWEKIFAN